MSDLRISRVELSRCVELIRRVRYAVEEQSPPQDLLELSFDVSGFAETRMSPRIDELLHSLLHVLADQDIALQHPEFRLAELKKLRSWEEELKAQAFTD